jgi:tripeptide aminopeptidase
MSATATAQRRIANLATLTAVHRAFHWLHLHQPQLRQWQLDLVRIPAPPFNESARAAWVLDRFQQLSLSNPHIDEEGNVLAEITAPQNQIISTEGNVTIQPLHRDRNNSVISIEDDTAIQPLHRSAIQNSVISTESGAFAAAAERPASLPQTPVILISAHLDTVFPAGTNCEPVEHKDTPRIHAPGICDNVAGLTGLLAIAAALRYANITPPIPILFAANVGEEGEGDLRGMRHLFERSPYASRIAAAIALEGSGTSAVVTRALGSLRFRVTITGPGGHSWSDAGTPNPILLLSRALTQIADLDLPTDPLTTINVGHISGGTSINSIPETATALLDLRSTDAAQLTSTATEIHQIFDHLLTSSTTQNTTTKPAKLHIETIGNRPAATLPTDSPILQTLRAVDRHLSLRTDQRLGSTDANIPLSKNIPAIAIGTGGIGGGIHTLQEWYDPTGRETALRRILLTLLDITQTTAEPHLT